MKRTYTREPCQIKVQLDNTLRYVHPFGDELRGTCWSLLSEVAEGYKPTFEKIIEEFKLEIERGVELDQKPWVADRIKEQL